MLLNEYGITDTKAKLAPIDARPVIAETPFTNMVVP